MKNLSGTEIGYKKLHLSRDVGSVVTSYSDLVEVFGEPEIISDDAKSRVAWIIEFRDGIIAEIVDYNQFLVDDYHDVKIWNIRGFGYNAPCLVNHFLDV